MKTPEQEANELVEMFIPFFYYDNNGYIKAINIASRHVERLIEVLGEMPNDYISGKLHHHYQQVLQILKDKK